MGRHKKSKEVEPVVVARPATHYVVARTGNTEWEICCEFGSEESAKDTAQATNAWLQNKVIREYRAAKIISDGKFELI